MVTFEVPTYDGAAYPFPVDPLNDVLAEVDAHEKTRAYIDAQNVNPVTRLRYNDHGPKHVEVVLHRAIELYRLLKAGDVEFNGASDHGLTEAEEPVIIALGAILHDIGHVVHRHRHSYYSVGLADTLLDELLSPVYGPTVATKLSGEILHAIVSHHREETPLTREAGVVRIADSLDMERGRSRQPYEQGGRGINTISSRAIKSVNLGPGDDVPAHIEIEMTSAAGIYQVDELLKSKVHDSKLAEFIRIIAVRVDDEDRLVDRIEF